MPAMTDMDERESRFVQLLVESVGLAWVKPSALRMMPRDALGRLLVRLKTLTAQVEAAVMLPPAPEPAPEPEPDVLLDVVEVGALLHRSKSWIRRHSHELPGMRQPSGKGGRVMWSKRALEEWIQSGGVLHH
jgi:hypothetical protein